MAADRSAFVVVSFEAPMVVMWRALRVVRTSLGVARVYWRPDEGFRDGRHFRFEIPVVELNDPATAANDIEAILLAHGATLL